MGSTFSNIVGAILVALMLVVGINIAGDIIMPSGHEPAETGTEEAAPPSAAAPEGEPQQAAAPEEEEAAPEEAEQQAAAPEGEAAPADEAAPAPAASGDEALTLIATADVQAGQSVAKKCAACHTFNEGGANRVGPNLFGVIGADIAAHEGYRYSNALSSKEGTWTYEAMSEFLTKPSAAVPGTKMTFAGVPDPKERANLIAYLRSISPAAPPPPQG